MFLRRDPSDTQVNNRAFIGKKFCRNSRGLTLFAILIRKLLVNSLEKLKERD